MDADGTKAGFDLELIGAVRAVVDVPVIASGGAGRVAHFPPAIGAGRRRGARRQRLPLRRADRRRGQGRAARRRPPRPLSRHPVARRTWPAPATAGGPGSNGPRTPARRRRGRPRPGATRALPGACRRVSTPCTVSTVVASPARGRVRQSCSPSGVIRNQPSATLTSPAPTSRRTAASTSCRSGIAWLRWSAVESTSVRRTPSGRRLVAARRCRPAPLAITSDTKIQASVQRHPFSPMQR